MSDPTAFTAVNPVLPVRNLGASVDFYTARLGFAFVFGDRVGSPLPGGAGAPGYAGVSRGDVQIHLQWQAESEFAQGTVGLAMLRIQVGDPDVLCEEYRASGAIDGRTTVRRTSWGTREFHVRDPDGHGLTFYCEL